MYIDSLKDLITIFKAITFLIEVVKNIGMILKSVIIIRAKVVRWYLKYESANEGN